MKSDLSRSSSSIASAGKAGNASPRVDVPMRQAALVIPVRQGVAGPEVFMMQRHGNAAFVPGVHVFPGGAVDPADALPPVCSGALDDAAASTRLGVAAGGLAYWVGAIRECFEEAGLLLARNPRGEWLLPEGVGRDTWQQLRLALHQGDLTLAEVCRRLEASLAVEDLYYLSHWVTPPGQRRRFDTRFFVAQAPEGQDAAHDGQETVASCWIKPGQALDAYHRGEFPLVYATRTTLQLMSDFDTTEGFLRFVAELREIPAIMPRMAQGKRGLQAVGPREPAYDEICKIDPEGEGAAFYDIEPGRPVVLAPGVLRLTAPNPGYMTGPGTNTYLLGNEQGVTVIDPGPALPEHVEAILKAAPGPIRQVLVTHTHSDHSPAVALLREHADFTALGWAARHDGKEHDAAFVPDREPQDGEQIPSTIGPLRVLHTPGHAANHLCFLLESEGLLFTGDHIMQGSTVVISPPDGDMATYLRSLERLLDEPVTWLAPAHGFTLHNAHQVVRDLIDHRLRREALVLKALRQHGAALPEEDLLARVYTQLPAALKPVAARSLRAHLLKLLGEGKVEQGAEGWQAL